MSLSRDYEKWRDWQRTSKPLSRKTPLRSKGRINQRNDERAERERNRAYGPPERRRMVRRMACAVPECHEQSENAHLPGAGGMGYKGDADTVCNLCPSHHRTHTDSLHNLGSVEAFEDRWGVWLPEVAEEVERKWQAREAG